jgi:hypothetical protein
MEMERDMDRLREELEVTRAQLRRVERERATIDQERHVRTALVRVHRGAVVRHSGER